jgi:hypothetical protein
MSIEPNVMDWLRRPAQQEEYCEPCLVRNGKKVNAYAVIAGSPMCAVCFSGTPQTGTLPIIVNGKAVPGRLSQKYAKSYAEVSELMEGKRERVEIPVNQRAAYMLRSNILRKGWKKGIRLKSHYDGKALTITRYVGDSEAIQ